MTDPSRFCFYPSLDSLTQTHIRLSGLITPSCQTPIQKQKNKKKPNIDC